MTVARDFYRGVAEIEVLWDVTLYRLVKSYGSFEESYAV
jgi:hypothetical protein